MQHPNKRIKLGITLSQSVGQFQSAIWAHGIGQNVAFLAMMFGRMHDVDCYVIVGDLKDSAGTSLAGAPIIDGATAADQMDVLIEIGLRLEAEKMMRFRERGGKLVSYMAGNALVMNFETVANGTAYGEIPTALGFDATWMTPQHWHMNRGFCEVTRSKIVRSVPHIWAPCFLQESVQKENASDFFYKQRPDDGWRIGIFDPTVNVVKTFHLPLLVCEEAERRDPTLIRNVMLFSATQFIGNLHFEEMIQALNLGQKGKVTAEPRFPITSVLGRHVDAVVTHQWENELNYLYWDTLYAGRPLIHNAAALSDVGAYYAPFDPADGGRVMADALRAHNGRTVEARARELEFLWQFNMDNPHVQAEYRGLLQEVLDAKV